MAPYDVEKVYGKKGQVKVKATFDDQPYHGSIANMGTGSHIIILTKEVRKQTGKSFGDKVLVVIEEDKAERVVEIPELLQDAFKKNEKASLFFDTLSYSNRKEYAQWISLAKKEETKLRRLSGTMEKLSLGIKNPYEK